MQRFNVEGSTAPERHYCIPPLSRVNVDEILDLVEDMRYFLLHAPRQSGKTSTLEALADHVNASGDYRRVKVNVQGMRHAGADLEKAVRHVLE